MKTHEIDLNSFLSKGYVVSDVVVGELTMTTTFNTGFKRVDENGEKMIGRKMRGNAMIVPSYLYLPNKYKLPLCIDLTVKIDSPSLHIMLGDGRLTFGREQQFLDISGESNVLTKPPQHPRFYIPYSEYFTISILFDFNFMQVMVNDETRYFSENERYMKLKSFREKNNDGLEIKITCDKNSALFIKDMTVTEYENDIPKSKMQKIDMPPYQPWQEKPEKYDFEYCMSGLSKELQNEVKLTNNFIMNLKPLKFKRKIDGIGLFGKIGYVSEFGLSYVIYIERNVAVHSVGWIIYNTVREREKYGGARKRELTGKTLEKLAETSPEFAEQMWNNLAECFGCGCAGRAKPCKLDGCVHCNGGRDGCTTLIVYNGKKKAVCHGRMWFKMTPSDYADARKVIETLNDVLFTL